MLITLLGYLGKSRIFLYHYKIHYYFFILIKFSNEKSQLRFSWGIPEIVS